MQREDWRKFQDYIADRLKEIDPHVRSTKGSGNQGELGDVNNKVDLCIECKLRNTKSVTINADVWKKLCREIPLHSKRKPMYALQNKEKEMWAVLNLDDFLDIFIEWWQLKQGQINGK